MGTHPMVNHVEMIYQPGQRDAAQALFETMGFATFTIPGGPWLGVNVDPESALNSDNVMYANEPTPAQRNFDAAFDRVLASDSELADTLRRYQAIRRKHPQYVFHFGASVPTEQEWDARVAALQEANDSHPLLKGRLDVKVSKPGVPDALGPLHQVFLYTDIISTGPGAICPVLFDLQWIPPHRVDDTSIQFPDMSKMV
ncbi:MAG: hypothetical protein ITG02_14090 [Patulibacter sp.]|nr:hypothetical protein [Patulibacter sp.]